MTMHLWLEVPIVIGWRVLRTPIKHFEDRIHQLRTISVELRGDDRAGYRCLGFD